MVFRGYEVISYDIDSTESNAFILIKMYSNNTDLKMYAFKITIIQLNMKIYNSIYISCIFSVSLI